MQPFIETGIALALAMIGFAVGSMLGSRLKRGWWWLAALLALGAVLMVALPRRFEQLLFIFPFSVVMEGRREFYVLAFAVAMLLTMPISKLREKRERVVMRLLVVVAVCYFSVLPFLQPALIRPKMQNIEREFIRYTHPQTGATTYVCIQQYTYTCGPAAAVSVLRTLGIEAAEGELAVAVHTSPIAGTAADTLQNTLMRRYADEGLTASYQYFESVDDLPADAYTLTPIRYTLTYDHFVAVYGRHEDHLLVADPMWGLRWWAVEDFRERWRNIGVVVRREGYDVPDATQLAPPPDGEEDDGASGAGAGNGESRDDARSSR